MNGCSNCLFRPQLSRYQGNGSIIDFRVYVGDDDEGCEIIVECIQLYIIIVIRPWIILKMGKWSLGGGESVTLFR